MFKASTITERRRNFPRNAIGIGAEERILSRKVEIGQKNAPGKKQGSFPSTCTSCYHLRSIVQPILLIYAKGQWSSTRACSSSKGYDVGCLRAEESQRGHNAGITSDREWGPYREFGAPCYTAGHPCSWRSSPRRRSTRDCCHDPIAVPRHWSAEPAGILPSRSPDVDARRPV